MDVRHATADDYGAYAAISGEVGQQHHDAHPDLLKSHAPTEAEYLELLRDGGILLATDGGEIAGVLAYRIVDRPETVFTYPRRDFYVSEMGVSSRHRRKGIGEQLMRHAAEIAKAHGVTRMSLVVWSFNEGAIAFYERMGFAAQSISMSRSLE